MELDIPNFMDSKDIGLGNDISETIGHGIRDCTHILVILSVSSLKSHWVPFELGQARARGIPILPYLEQAALNVPVYIRNILISTSLEDLRSKLLVLRAAPVSAQRPSREPRVRGGFMILESYEDGEYTAPRSAHGWYELKMSLDYTTATTDSIFHVRSVRDNAFDPDHFPSCSRICLRVGTSERFGVVRNAINFPLESDHAEIRGRLASEHGWDLGETKQFFATTGPEEDPCRYRSGPLTVKRVE